MEIRQLAIYPVKGEPGRLLEEAQVEPEGFAGDRRKKQPVHLVGGRAARVQGQCAYGERCLCARERRSRRDVG